MATAVVMQTSRSNNNLSGSIRSAEARKAVEAAEFGMQAILDALNSNKNSYLLVTRFTNASGTGTWQSVSTANLSACGIQVPIPAPSANRIAGVSSNSSSPSAAMPNETGVTYSMVGFDPPSGASRWGQRLRHVRQRERRAGGDDGARHREPGGAEKARFDLIRSFTVTAVNKPDPNSVGLMVTGPPSKSKLGKPFYIVYDDNDDAEDSLGRGETKRNRGQCELCGLQLQLRSRFQRHLLRHHDQWPGPGPAGLSQPSAGAGRRGAEGSDQQPQQLSLHHGRHRPRQPPGIGVPLPHGEWRRQRGNRLPAGRRHPGRQQIGGHPCRCPPGQLVRLR